MELYELDEEFQFALEMVILNRNENGATLSEIRDDFENYYGMNFESTWGYRCWEQQIQPMLTHAMSNIRSETLSGGCILYYMNIDAAIVKLSPHNLSENMARFCAELNIDINALKEMRDATMSSQSRSSNNSQSDSIRNTQPKSTSSLISTGSDGSEFYGHLLIGDNFFLEMAHIDLERKLTGNRNRIKQIGHCVSGQNIRRATTNIARVIDKIQHDGVIINLGTVDLLQGRELVDMMRDMYKLCGMLCDKRIFPILTTLPPLANQMHNNYLEEKRKAFNTFLVNKFDCIDIERCFLSSYNRILFDLYQPTAKLVTGTRCSIVLWNHVGRQRVVKMLKRKIPDIHGEYY